MLTHILSGNFISVNGKNYTPKIEYYENTTDRVARLLGLKRQIGESNLALRARCQNYSLSSTLAQKIGASLGLSTPFYWDTGYQLTVLVSGSSSPNFPRLHPFRKLKETASVIDNKITLNSQPLGHVTLRLDNDIVDPKTFSLSGNMITVYDGQLKELINKNSIGTRVSVEYRVQTYSFVNVNTSGGALYLNTPTGEGQTLLLGTIPSNVVIEELPQTDMEFRWDRGHQSNSGLGTFGGDCSINTAHHYN